MSPLNPNPLWSAGDLAKKKIYPSLFALYHDGMLPKDFTIYGYARSKMTDDEFRQSIEGSLPCRLSDGAKCGETMGGFLERCCYQHGQYKSNDDFGALSERMSKTEKVLFGLFWGLGMKTLVVQSVSWSGASTK